MQNLKSTRAYGSLFLKSIMASFYFTNEVKDKHETTVFSVTGELWHKEPVKLIQRVKIANSFLQSVSILFHFIILSLPM